MEGRAQPQKDNSSFPGSLCLTESGSVTDYNYAGCHIFQKRNKEA